MIPPKNQFDQDQYALLFILYRVIGGIGVGIASMLSPVYISEIAPASIRGKLVSYNQLAIVAGFMIVYFVNAGIGQSGDDTWLNEIGWRYMFLSELIPVILFLILLNYVPDTPIWCTLVIRLFAYHCWNNAFSISAICWYKCSFILCS